MKHKSLLSLILIILSVLIIPASTFAEGGYTWTRQDGSGSRAWSHVAMSADGSRLIASVYGAGGYVYLSNDYGVTWNAATGAGARNWYWCSISSNGSKMTASDYGGYVYVSTDYGVTWNAATTLGIGNWWAVNVSPNGEYILASKVGGNTVSRSTDDGATWSSVSGISGNDGSKLDISGDSSTAVVLDTAVSPNNLYVSTDSGQNWTAHTLPQQAANNYIGATVSGNGSRMFLMNGFGYTQFSSNGGASWATSTGATTAQGRGPSMSYNGLKVIAPVWTGRLSISLDGGDTYTSQVSAGSRNWYSTDISSNGNRIVASDYNGYIYTAVYSDITPPSSPSSVVATPSGNTVNIGWTNPADGDFASITIRRSTVSYPTSATDGTAVTQGQTGTTYSDTNLSNGTYYYSLFAIDTSDNESNAANVSVRVGGPGRSIHFKPVTVTTYGGTNTVITPGPQINRVGDSATTTLIVQTPKEEGIKSTPVATTSVMTTSAFTKDLYLGVTDSQVKLLQQYLNNHGYTISTNGLGSPNSETTFFGSKTKSALIKFQQDHNIVPASGYFGSLTRGVMGQ